MVGESHPSKVTGVYLQGEHLTATVLQQCCSSKHGGGCMDAKCLDQNSSHRQRHEFVTETWEYKFMKVLTAHSKEGKRTHITNNKLKHSRTYQPSNAKDRVKMRRHINIKLSEPPIRQHTLANVTSSKSKLHKVTLLTICVTQLIDDTLPYVAFKIVFVIPC